MKIHFVSLIVLLTFLIGYSNVFSQEIQVIKSEIIEEIDGTEYHLHFVKQGETLYNIAAAYGLTVSKIFQSNPEAKNGIGPGQILKIPSTSKKQDVAEIKESQSEFFYHIIKKQETLYGISKKYGVTIDEIKALNPKMGDYPKVGQTLKIPEVSNDISDTRPTWDGEMVKHKVKKGETLYSIAKQYNITIGEIKNANPDLSYILDIGQFIAIPNQEDKKDTHLENKKPAQSKFIEHTVAGGETLYTIARNYATSVDTIKNYNYGLTENLYIGQSIKIPNRERSQNYITHKTEKKDKIQKIANKYDVSVEEVLALNPGISKRVSKGQEVKIPLKEVTGEIIDTASIKKVIPVDITSPCYNPDNMESTYNIALMIPLFLEEIDSLYIKEDIDKSTLVQLKSFKFIQFYEGFIMAVDSMKNQGMNLNLFVYDVDNSSEKANAVLQASELSSMDLIIGPFYSKSFEKVSAFAKTYNINIVNPLSVREEIIFDNPNVFKVKPTVQAQSDILAEMIPDQYPEDNIVIVRHNNYKYQHTASFLKNSINSSRITRISIPNQDILYFIKKNEEGNKLYSENVVLDKEKLAEHPEQETFFSNTVKEAIYSSDSIGGIETNLSYLRNNIIITLTNQNVFSQELFSQLNKLSRDYQITLFAIPGWKEPENLETDHLLNLNYHHFTSGLINNSNRNVKNWIQLYRDRFKTDPSINKYAFDGFDVGYYFLNALYKYGSDFGPCLDNFNIDLLNTKYKYRKQIKDGYENTYWDLCNYKNFDVIKVEYNNN